MRNKTIFKKVVRVGKNFENIVAYLKLLCRDSSGHKQETATKKKKCEYLKMRPRFELEASTNYKYMLG